MNCKTLTATLALTGAAVVTSSATAAINVASSLTSWTSGLGTFANSWVIPSNAPNGGYDWTSQVNSNTTSGTVADDGFYYAGISFSGTGLVSTTNGSSLSITATTSAPVTVTFTFNANVRAAGFLVGAATSPPTSITMFVNGAALSPNVMALNNSPSVGSNLGFFGAMASGADVISTLTVTINAGQTVELTGAYLQLVPAPGAVALLGVAGLVGGRRRR